MKKLNLEIEEKGSRRHRPPGARRDVLLAQDGSGHMLVHVAHEARHEGPQQREQRQELGVVRVHHVGPQRTQRGDDLARVQDAQRVRERTGREARRTPWSSRPV